MGRHAEPVGGIMDTGRYVVRKAWRMTQDCMLNAPFVVEMVHTAATMYSHGWDERNGGNISLLLGKDEVAPYVDANKIVRVLPLGFSEPRMAGKYLLVTGTGKYFKNVQYDPAANLGLVRISDDAATAELLWGFSDGGTFTSEMPAHLMSHATRLEVDDSNRVVMHCHPTNLLAMTFVHELDEREFTRTLWQMCSECIVVFPEGVGVLPWMLCGTEEIGRATARKMREFRLVVWGQHGIYGVGSTLDEAFGLIETVEKAAEVYLKIAHLPRLNTITDEQLHQLEKRFGVTAHEGFLD